MVWALGLYIAACSVDVNDAGRPQEPFPPGCSVARATSVGDFDGDERLDRSRFFPARKRRGSLEWEVRLELASGESSLTTIAAACPETIGARDLDRDGRDELFYDTGCGMTAALIDVLKFEGGRLKNVQHIPSLEFVYVGGSNAGSSDVRCGGKREHGKLIEIRTSRLGARTATRTEFTLRDMRLVKTDERRVQLARDLPGKLICFGLRWRGY